MTWNAYHYNMNKNVIEPFDVFQHIRFKEDTEKHLKKCKTKEEFAEKLQSELRYYFWSKSEYECIIRVDDTNHIFLIPWCGCREPEKMKINVSNDTNFDWKKFAEYHINRQIYKNEAKIDVYEQVMWNWNEFVDSIWNKK